MVTRTLSILMVLACASLTVAIADDYVWQDGTFSDSDWDMHVFYKEGNGGTTSAWQVLSGGNPGPFRMIENVVNDAPPYSGIGAFHRYIPVVYDPAVSGAITTIDYEEDAIMVEGAGDGQATGPAVRQAGVVYYHWIGGTAYAEWTHLSVYSLTAADFRDTPYTYLHPDFSADAPPLEIGFYRANSTYSGGYTILSGIDNWSFTIHTGQPTAVESTSWGRIRALYR